MGDRFYRQKDNLAMNLQTLHPRHRRPKGVVPTYYLQLAAQKAKQSSKTK